MAKQTINHGITAGDKTGESLFSAFQKANANFTELYDAMTTVAADKTLFPAAGDPTRIYVALDTGVAWRWTGSAYQALGWNATGTALVNPVSGREIKTGKGCIVLITPDTFTDGVPDGASLSIPSATINSAATGTPVTWSDTTLDTTDGAAWTLANPARIYIPDGVTEANFTAALGFSANGTGSRMLRLLLAGTVHYSNMLIPTTIAGMAQTVPLPPTGWIPVVAGTYFQIHAVQDSGSTLTSTASNQSNGGGSCYCRVDFR